MNKETLQEAIDLLEKAAELIQQLRGDCTDSDSEDALSLETVGDSMAEIKCLMEAMI